MTSQLQNFLIGAETAAFIPFVSFCYGKYVNWKELKAVKEMIFKEYINPLENLTDQLTTDNFVECHSEAGTMVKRLNYLLDNEIKYMGSENRFAVIRMIQYTTMYMKAVRDNIKIYQMSNWPNHVEAIEKTAFSIKVITEHYKKTLNDYMSLKRDYLIKKEEKITLRN